MTREQLTARLTGPFRERFADTLAAEVLEAACESLLYDLATGDCRALPAPQRHKELFRGAYVLERIFFRAPERFAPCEERFCRHDFAACTDPGARRCFAKMMASLLARKQPDAATTERIATAAADWAADAAARPAVRIWAMRVLQRCRGRVEWIDRIWDDLLQTLARDATPAMVNYLHTAPIEGLRMEE